MTFFFVCCNWILSWILNFFLLKGCRNFQDGGSSNPRPTCWWVWAKTTAHSHFIYNYSPFWYVLCFLWTFVHGPKLYVEEFQLHLMLVSAFSCENFLWYKLEWWYLKAKNHRYFYRRGLSCCTCISDMTLVYINALQLFFIFYNAIWCK